MERSCVAILLSESERAEELRQVLASPAIEVVVAQTLDRLHRLLKEQAVDLLVLDQELPGFMSGLEALERFRADRLSPATILLCSRMEEAREKAQSLGIERTLRWDEELAIIGQQVQQLIARRAQALEIPALAWELVEKSSSIAPLPQVIAKAARFLGSAEEVSVEELCDLISVDPRVTAEVIRMVNSPAVGVRRRVTNIADAVGLLGARRTVALTLSSRLIGTKESPANSRMPPGEQLWYQKRCVLISSTASAFAQHLGDRQPIDPDTAQVLGLLQDMGISLLASASPRSYAKALNRFRTKGNVRLEAIERESFDGISHAEVGAAMLERWGLPRTLVMPVRDHHRPETFENKTPTERQYLLAMQVGEAVANLTDGHTAQRYPVLRRLLDEYGPSRESAIKQALQESVMKTADSCELFHTPMPDARELESLLDEIARQQGDRFAYLPPAEAEGEAAEAKVPKAISAPRPRPAFPAPAGAQAAQRPRVLLIEDEPTVVDIVTRQLELVGVEVVSCLGLEEARPLAGSAAAILVDVHLLDEDGVHVVHVLRQDGFAGPVIMVTGDMTRNTVGRSILAGATDYLGKPFDQATLIDKLRKHTGLALQPVAQPPA